MATTRIPRERVIAVATPLLRVVAGGLVVACLSACAWVLGLMAMSDDRFMIDPRVLIEESLPSWMPTALAMDMQSSIRSIEAHSIFEPRLGDHLRNELVKASPWIRGVSEFERVFPNRARIALELERPAISADHQGKRYLISEAGKVLAAVDASLEFPFPFLVLDVMGARFGPVPVVGKITTNEDLLLAAKSVAELASMPEADRATFASLQPVAIDLDSGHHNPQVGKDEVFIRLADNNVLIRWGRPRDTGFGKLEIPVERKMQHLRQLIQSYPKLVGLQEVRLDLADGVQFLPLGFERSWQFLDPEPAKRP